MMADQATRDDVIPAFLDRYYAAPINGRSADELREACTNDAVMLIEDVARLYGLAVTIERPAGSLFPRRSD